MRTGRPNIKDVAREAGVGTTTVTRVLNGDRNVTEATRALVESAIQGTGYQVNSLARGLKQQRSFVIGHLLLSAVTNPFYVTVASGVEAYARTAGYTALTLNFERAPEAERRGIETFLNWRADALIFTTPLVAANVEFALARGLPVMQVERPKTAAAPGIKVNNTKGAQAAMRHLVDLGHREIAYIGGYPVTDQIGYVEQERVGAYREAMAAIGGAPREFFLAGPQYLTDAEHSLAPGYQATKALLAGPRRPTAIQCTNDIIAAGALQALREAGLDVPGDISIIGFDDTLGAYLAPQLTTVRLPAYELGQTAARLLIDGLNGVTSSLPSHTISLDAELVVRRSTGPVRH